MQHGLYLIIRGYFSVELRRGTADSAPDQRREMDVQALLQRCLKTQCPGAV
jgi:hypothetical protein